MRRLILTLLAALAIGAFCPPALALEDPATSEPRTDLEKLRHALDQMSRQVSNAEARLRNGAVSMGDGEEDAVSESPARLCCGKNLDAITKELETVARGIQGLRGCYQAAGNAEAEIDLNFVFQDAASLFRALGNFSNASRRDLMMGHGAVVKGVILLRKSSDKLIECAAD